VNRRVVTTGAAIAGAVAFVLALVPGVAALVPTAAAVDAVGNDYFLLSAFGAVSLAVFGWMALRRAAGQVAQADPPDPETVPDAPRPGSRFDERLGRRPWGLDDADRRALVERLRAAAVAHEAGTGTARETARERVASGEWTDDPVAARFLAERPPPLGTRLRLALRGDSWTQHGARAVATELLARSDER